MKKFWALLLCLALVLSLVACGKSDDTPAKPEAETNNTETDDAAEDYSLNLICSSGYSSAVLNTDNMYYPLMDALEEQTGGKVTYDLYTDGSLVALGAEYEALRAGTMDVAMSLYPLYDSARFPLTECIMLPALSCDTVAGTGALFDLMNSDVEIKDGKTYRELEWEDKGLVAFPTAATDGYWLLTHGVKLDSLDKFDTKIAIRTNSSVAELFCNNIGLTPLSISASEVYDAMSRGACDGLFLAPDWNGIGVTELLDYGIPIACGNSSSFIAVTQETWESWPEEVRTIFADTCEDIIFNGNWFIESQALQVEDMKAAGGEVVEFDTLPEDVQALISEAVVKTWHQWIDKLESNGQPGKALAILYRDLVVENGGIYPDEIMNLESYTPNV